MSLLLKSIGQRGTLAVECLETIVRGDELSNICNKTVRLLTARMGRLGIRIVMTGASGFVGRALKGRLTGRRKIIALDGSGAAVTASVAKLIEGDFVHSAAVGSGCEALVLQDVVVRPNGVARLKSALISDALHAGKPFCAPVSSATTLWLMSAARLAANSAQAIGRLILRIRSNNLSVAPSQFLRNT